MSEYVPVAVIGAGPAGVAAAISATRAGKKVVILEAGERMGKKLLATGNGRCNLLNADMSRGHFHGSLSCLVPGLVEEFGENAVEDFWRELGIETVTLEKGKKYPRSLTAASVVNALLFAIDENGIELRTGVRIRKIEKKAYKGDKCFYLPDADLFAGRVVLAVGGKASPGLGALGDGYDICRAFGMEVSALRPAICRVRCTKTYPKMLSGLKLDAKVSLFDINDKEKRIISEKTDELLFTADGMSGPVIFDLSREVGEIKTKGGRPAVSVDFIPEMPQNELFLSLMRRMSSFPDRSPEGALNGLAPKILLQALLKASGIGNRTLAGGLSKKEIAELTRVWKNYQLEIDDTDGFKDAQVTVGGVKDLNVSLESKNCPGLYLAGELMDVDGDCGGYNLYWAVISGIKAGLNAAAFEEKI